MNSKRLGILFLICVVLLISINVISAGDNDTLIKKSDSTILKTNQTQNSTIVSKNTTSKIKTAVSTPDLGFVYKKNSYMKITVKDNSTKKPVKNLKIKVKVFIKRGKSKIYTLKTDAKGIAKLSTKNFKLGYHKFFVNTANTKYKVYKKAYFFIGKMKSISLKINKYKKLKNGDALKIFAQNTSKGVYTQVWYAGAKSDVNPHYTMILQAKLFFKNKKTGKIISKSIKGKLFTNNGQIYKDLPHYNLTKTYTPIKAKIWYLTSR